LFSTLLCNRQFDWCHLQNNVLNLVEWFRSCSQLYFVIGSLTDVISKTALNLVEWFRSCSRLHFSIGSLTDVIAKDPFCWVGSIIILKLTSNVCQITQFCSNDLDIKLFQFRYYYSAQKSSDKSNHIFSKLVDTTKGSLWILFNY